MAEIVKVKIHPAIGVARLGDHPTATFDGPQKPFDTKAPFGGYKKDGKIKRQAAVFRLFGYDASGKVVKEITTSDADIRWQVELANKKAFGAEFNGPDPDPALRNPNVAAAQRHRLAIQPTPKFVDLTSRTAEFDDGKFTSWKKNGTSPKNVNDIFLGELKMDSSGFLRVLGARGTSKSPHNLPLGSYANNDSWYDDVADGPVNATVVLSDTGETFEAETAWVLCAPPSFAPQLRNIITLYDMFLDRAKQNGLYSVPTKPSFAFEVYPMLKASFDIKFVKDIGSGHSFDSLLNASSPIASRNALVSRLRKIDGSGSSMPKLFDDNNQKRLSITSVQHEVLKRWAAGNVKTTGVHAGPPTPPADITPDGMDRAALESCVGGAFFPGIEAGWFLRDKYDLVTGDLFRLSVNQNNIQCPILKAGDVTKQMALPWQADFAACEKESTSTGSYGWWPAARPDDVYVGSATVLTDWAGSAADSYLDMVKKWDKLEFVVKKGDRYEVEP